MIKAMMAVAEESVHIEMFKLSTQAHAISFYEQLGFVAYGDVYDDTGIPHRNMKRII